MIFSLEFNIFVFVVTGFNERTKGQNDCVGMSSIRFVHSGFVVSRKGFIISFCRAVVGHLKVGIAVG